MFGVFRVKNHDFTPKNLIFSIAEGGAKIFEVFRVKNHDFTPKNRIFFQFQGGRAPGAATPESAPGIRRASCLFIVSHREYGSLLSLVRYLSIYSKFVSDYLIIHSHHVTALDITRTALTTTHQLIFTRLIKSVYLNPTLIYYWLSRMRQNYCILLNFKITSLFEI